MLAPTDQTTKRGYNGLDLLEQHKLNEFVLTIAYRDGDISKFKADWNDHSAAVEFTKRTGIYVTHNNVAGARKALLGPLFRQRPAPPAVATPVVIAPNVNRIARKEQYERLLAWCKECGFPG